MTDPADEIAFLYRLSDGHLNRTGLKMNKSGIYVIVTFNDHVISRDCLYTELQLGCISKEILFSHSIGNKSETKHV